MLKGLAIRRRALWDLRNAKGFSFLSGKGKQLLNMGPASHERSVGPAPFPDSVSHDQAIFLGKFFPERAGSHG
jgi:hypothetical protein